MYVLINQDRLKGNCDRDNYDINKAAKHIAESTTKKDSKKK